MLAVVEISGKQYIAEPKATLIVDRIDGNEGDKVTFNHVLLVSDDKKTSVGTPYVKGKTVTATILKQAQGEKLYVRRYKQKVRYRKTTGFRAQETHLTIEEIL